ncbi:MAG: hypothetical protein ABSA79_09235 [Candidatus Bathyarchaeia archaeon]
MVKFQERKIKKKYKQKEYESKKFLMEFPVKANPKIEPHKCTTYDEIDITTRDNPKQEILNISLMRNKTLEEINEKKSK